MILRRSLVVALLLLPAVSRAQVSLPAVDVRQALERQRAGTSILVDVRTPEEWAETGTPKGAVRIDMTSDTFVVQLDALRKANPGKDIDLICRTASRSSYVQRALAASGWKGLVNVRGGMAGSPEGIGWIDAKLPLER